MTVGISISESEDIGVRSMGQMHLQDAMVEVARFLLNKHYHLIYGGDLGYSGGFNFTELLFQLAMTYGGDNIRVTNYAVFPLYLKITKKREADVNRVANIERINATSQQEKWLKKRYETLSIEEREYIDRILRAEDEESKQIWAENLTRMRNVITEKTDCKIVMGGKLTNFKGTYPGVVEETILAVEKGVTVFLDGRMGGAALHLIKSIDGGVLREPYTKRTLDLREVRVTDLGPDQICIQGTKEFPEIEKYLRYFL